MAYNLSQGTKDIDADIFQGFGSSFSGFIPHSYNVNDGISLDHDTFPSMDDHHALSLQPDDESLQTPFFSLNSKFNPMNDVLHDHDNTSSQISLHSITSPLSLQADHDINDMQFPSHDDKISSVSLNNNTAQHTHNPSPGSTASTTSLHQLQPKSEPNFGFDTISNLHMTQLPDALQNLARNNNQYYNNANVAQQQQQQQQYMNTSLNMKQNNEIKHEPQMYDKVINDFMTDYQNDKKQQEHKTSNRDWMLGAVPFVPPSYTNSATARINSSGLCENIPYLPQIPAMHKKNLLSVAPNYAISNLPAANNAAYVSPPQYYHPIVSAPNASNIAAPLAKSSTKYNKAASATNAKKYQCLQCAKKFKHQSNLKIHLIVHTDKALVCKYCSKKFARKTNLKQHERVHTGERPFECNICKRKFKQKHSLKDHIKIHTGEKPFVCECCNKSFKIKHNLTLHMRTHASEKTQQCSVCLMSFESHKDLRNHKFECGAAANVMPTMSINNLRHHVF